jgi:hypothetical protein
MKCGRFPILALMMSMFIRQEAMAQSGSGPPEEDVRVTPSQPDQGTASGSQLPALFELSGLTLRLRCDSADLVLPAPVKDTPGTACHRQETMRCRSESEQVILAMRAHSLHFSRRPMSSLVKKVAVYHLAILLVSGCGSAPVREQPTAPVPAILESIETLAEDAFDQALGSDFGAVEASAAAIALEWRAYREQALAAGAQPDDIEAMELAVSNFQADAARPN